MQMEPSTLTPTEVNAHERVRPEVPKIGGFLIVVAIGLIISCLRNLTGVGWALLPSRGDVWEKLTIPGSSAYHPYWKTVLLFELIFSLVTLALSVIGTALFFCKHRFFPTFVVVTLPVVFVLMVAAYYLEGLVPAIAASPAYGKAGHDLIVKFIGMHVWIPYFLVSARVKRTFVR